MPKENEQTADFAPSFIQIPLIIIKDQETRTVDSLVYGIVYWFEHLKDGKCYASNKTIGLLINVSQSSVADSLTRLEKAGFISRIYSSNGTRKEIKSLIDFAVIPLQKEGRVSSNEEPPLPQMRNRVKKNINIYSWSESERKQATDLHTGYVKLFRINYDDWAHSDPERRRQLMSAGLAKYKLTDQRLAKSVARLRDAGYDKCKKAIINANKSDWNHGSNPSGWKMDLYKYLFRNYEQVEDWSNRE